MMDRLGHEFVEFIPEELAPGVLYISRRYSTASHLCCCGCGLEVVTPLNPAKWRLSERGANVSLTPSVGNWSFPCRSHYWIEEGVVRWAGAMSPAAIAAVKSRDRKDADLFSRARPGRWAALWQQIADVSARVADYVRGLWPW
jgi:hypothetical protein